MRQLQVQEYTNLTPVLLQMMPTEEEFSNSGEQYTQLIGKDFEVSRAFSASVLCALPPFDADPRVSISDVASRCLHS